MVVYENFFLKFIQNFLSKALLKFVFSKTTIIKLFSYQSEWRALRHRDQETSYVLHCYCEAMGRELDNK